MSISRGSGEVDTSSAIEISSSVVLPRAESTATTRWPCSRADTIRRAARLMRSASATDVPPNFITTVPDTLGSLGVVGYAAIAIVQLLTYPRVKPPPGRVDDLMPDALGAPCVGAWVQGRGRRLVASVISTRRRYGRPAWPLRSRSPCAAGPRMAQRPRTPVVVDVRAGHQRRPGRRQHAHRQRRRLARARTRGDRTEAW